MSTNPQPQTEQQRNPWVEYERRKAELPKEISSAEREEALRKIADELGI